MTYSGLKNERHTRDRLAHAEFGFTSISCKRSESLCGSFRVSVTVLVSVALCSFVGVAFVRAFLVVMLAGVSVSLAKYVSTINVVFDPAEPPTN
jgi:hypothetical protein